MSAEREPAFNAPRVVVAGLALFILIHVARSLISEDADIAVLLRFAFIPARYDAASPYAADMLGGEGAKVWTFLTYAFLHGNWTHLIVNSVWMLAFGSALAWRFGTWRFLVFSGVTAAAGAATHLLFHFGTPTPVVGASAAISGHMAAAMRFIFEAGGPLSALRRRGPEAFSAPAEPFGCAIRRSQVIVFLTVWFGANLLFGLGSIAIVGADANVAWEAHIGGFLAGLAIFPLLDPIRARPEEEPSGDLKGEALRPDAADRHDADTGVAGRSIREG